MADKELVDATWWVAFWDSVESWAFLGVIITLAIEFAAHRFVVPYREKLETARELEVARLATESDTARAAIAGANQRAAEADERAAEARLELERLKTPRVLSANQKDRLVALLHPYAGQQFSLSVASDPEAISLLKSIQGVLEKAGWVRIPPQLGQILIGDAGQAFQIGVRLHISPEAPQLLVDRVTVLSTLLNEDGIASIAQRNVDLKNNEAINVMVGTKPLTTPLEP